MKNKNFTQKILLVYLACMGLVVCGRAQSTDLGTGWPGTSAGTEPILINENFQGFKWFHTDSDPNSGNSDNSLNADGTITYGYESFDSTFQFSGSSLTAKYSFYQCAFAPGWDTSYGYKDSLNGTSTSATTTGVSRGFVEISRAYSSTVPTVHGYFVVDLRNVDFLEGIQYSHSSTGGNKRGILVEWGKDSGDTIAWDTVRYQPAASAWANSFTKDPYTGVKTSNQYTCQYSAYGLKWEDGLYYEGGLYLRFSECNGQTPRIHDLKIYGELKGTGVNSEVANKLKVYNCQNTIRVSSAADVYVYSISGALVKSAQNVRSLDVSGLGRGIYITKAKAGNSIVTSKFVVD